MSQLRTYNRLLLLVAGLGGLLYGVDVGIIGGALPYLEATSGLNQGQLSIIVAAVLLGSVISTLFAGLLADWLGRKPLMLISGAVFVISIPVIALSHGFVPLFLGRLLQGVSGGLVGIVVPLYLAECLSAKDRGKGTAAFQWLLTLGVFSAALIGIYYSYRVAGLAASSSAAELFNIKDQAWRRIFWVSMPPGILFLAGALFVAESPRWLFRRERKEQALTALLRSRAPEQANLELEEMEHISRTALQSKGSITDSLLRRKYVLPFILACVILFCNTATGINSIIGYNTDILLQSGLSDLLAHLGLRAVHLPQLHDDDRRHDGRRSQGPQVSAYAGHVGHYHLPPLCRYALSAHRENSLRCPRGHPVDGGAGAKSHSAFHASRRPEASSAG